MLIALSLTLVALAVVGSHLLLWRLIMSNVTDLAETVLESAHAVSEKTDLVLQKLADVSAALATLQAAGGASQADLDGIATKLTDAQSTLAGTSAKEDAALVQTPPSAA